MIQPRMSFQIQSASTLPVGSTIHQRDNCCLSRGIIWQGYSDQFLKSAPAFVPQDKDLLLFK